VTETHGVGLLGLGMLVHSRRTARVGGTSRADSGRSTSAATLSVHRLMCHDALLIATRLNELDQG